MQKVLLVINACQPHLSSVNFACRIAALTESQLTGLFVENPYGKDEREPYTGGSYSRTVAEKEAGVIVQTDIDHAITLFVRDCATHKTAALVLVSKGEPIQEVIRESRYADLLIVDPGIDFYGNNEQLPSHFTKEILANAECPVLLSPEEASDVEEVVFCFDRSASSVFALKQFTYLFPEYKSTKIVLLEVTSAVEENSDDEHQRVLQWLHAHYNQVDCKILSGDTKDELFTYFFMKKKKLVVMGSYGRSALSTFFRRSAADSLIRAVDLPIFITHINR